jgi:hypothetical protein
MGYNSYLLDYGNDDILSLEFGKLFKLAKFREAMKSAFTNQDQVPYYLSSALNQKGIEINDFDINRILEKGIDSEVLRLGANVWQKGKVKIKVTLEFRPDEPEVKEIAATQETAQPKSPLDDLRQMINQETQQ